MKLCTIITRTTGESKKQEETGLNIIKYVLICKGGHALFSRRAIALRAFHEGPFALYLTILRGWGGSPEASTLAAA